MIQYATPAQLAKHLDPDSADPTVPERATVLIRAASVLVRDATAGARYDVTPEGYPLAPVVAQAFTDATCEQAAQWSLHKVDPRMGRSGVRAQVASKSLLGGSVSYAADARADQARSDLASGDVLAESALQILRQAGLISTRISAGGSTAYVADPDPRPYDPTSGRFIS